MRARAMPVLAVLVLVPSAAAADTLTPWVSGTSPFLWVATLLLGVLEGAILVRLFRLKLTRCIGFMIPANLLTSWIGLSLLRMVRGADIREAPWAVLLLVVVTYVLTLLFEWPFVALCVRGAPGWFRRSVKGSLIVQTASYGVLVIIGFAASFALPERDLAIIAGMKSDLRNLVTAQESYFTDHATYSNTLANLEDSAAANPYGTSPGNAVRIIEAAATGWSATIRREPPDNAQSIEEGRGTRKTCGIFVGTGTPPIPGQNEGEPKCR